MAVLTTEWCWHVTIVISGFHIFLLACLNSSYIHVMAVLTTEWRWHVTIVTSGFRLDVNEICAVCDFTRKRVVVLYRRFGTTCGSKNAWPLKLAPIVYPNLWCVTAILCCVQSQNNAVDTRYAHILDRQKYDSCLILSSFFPLMSVGCQFSGIAWCEEWTL
jgi:hypothetical protein